MIRSRHKFTMFKLDESELQHVSGMADLRAPQTEAEPFLEGRNIELTLESCADLVAELHKVATQVLLQNVNVRLQTVPNNEVRKLSSLVPQFYERGKDAEKF